jgi:hypothetical protein
MSRKQGLRWLQILLPWNYMLQTAMGLPCTDAWIVMKLRFIGSVSMARPKNHQIHLRASQQCCLLQGMQHTSTLEAMIFIWALQVLSGLGLPKYMESNPMYEFASSDLCCNAHFVRTERCIRAFIKASLKSDILSTQIELALKLLLQKLRHLYSYKRCNQIC